MTSSPRQSQTLVTDTAAAPSTEASILSPTDNEKPQDVETSPQISSSAPVPPPRNVTGVSWILVVISVLSSTFLFALDNTVTANIQPVIVTRFNAANLLPWISVAYLLGAASINLFWSVAFLRMKLACIG